VAIAAAAIGCIKVVGAELVYPLAAAVAGTSKEWVGPAVTPAA
jgi:hypothetical protein